MKRTALASEDVGHVFVFPQRGLAALHVADAADAVDDRLVVAVAGRHREQFRIALPVAPSATAPRSSR